MKQRLLYGILVLFAFMAGSTRTWALEQDAGGVYQIETAQDLIDFAALVNQGGANMSANAVLTADIDMTDQPWDNPIGNWINSVGYKGHFDGQGHKIENLVYTTAMNYHGLFGVLIDGAVVENFSIYGTITNESYDAIAAIAYSKNDVTPVNIRNIHSYLNLTTSGNDKKVGGILGNGNNGKTYVDRCIFSGSISSTDKTNCGGIVAYIQNNSNAYVYISNCLFDGNLESTISTAYCGGIVGYIGANSNRYTVNNCLSLGTITAPVAGSIFGYVRNAGGGFGNCYYLGTKTSGKTETTGADNVATSVSEDQLRSGEVCYNLNAENPDEPAFYQNIGEDEVPTLDSTHKRVYAIGERLCDGSFSGDVEYTNDSSGEGTIPDHDFDEGYCSVCGAMDMNYMVPVDGWYEISTARHLRWFADFVNAGNPSANAKVVDDINLAYEDVFAVIGNSPSAAYTGTFDGQGYELSGYFLTITEFTAGYGYGLFGNTNGATIKNFTINGEMSFENGGAAPSADLGCGLIGWPDGGTLIQNINNSIDIYANISTHVGGMVGSLRTATIDRCIYSGRLNGYSSKNGVAGIAGYTNKGTITNCIFNGKIEGDGTGYYAGILGYVNNLSASVQNCLSIGTVENEVSSYVAGVLGRVRSIGTGYANNYYTGELKGIGGGEASQDELVSGNTTFVTDEQLASGEVTWGLNGKTYIIPVFYQSLGSDMVPLMDDSHNMVYPTTDGFASMQTDDPMDDFLYSFTELQQEKAGKTIAYKQVIDDYMAAIEPLSNVETYEAFVEGYAGTKPQRDAVQESVKCYEAYIDVCAATADYMDKNDVGGKEFEQLTTYLTTDAEPDADFPNGTYHYILRMRQLTNEQVEAEAKNVDARLQAAIANNYGENTDITSMLVNPTFAEETAGWDTQTKLNVATAGSYTAAEATNTFSITQTVTGLKNGIYLFSANAVQCAGGDLASQYYAAQLVANGNMNYIQVPGEDYAEEKLYTDDKEYNLNGEVLGYVPVSVTGFTYAMAGERYRNYTAVRVTDGKLTVGITNPGTGIGTDQVLMGGLRLVYLGKGDSECQGLDIVLESYRKRAQVIIDFESSDGTDYVQRPNISSELKSALQACSDAIDEATTGEKKIALIDRFSALMQEVYECRKAYSEMAKLADELMPLADNLINSGAISDEMNMHMYDMADAAQEAFLNGKYTLKQALNAIKEMREYGNLFPPTDEAGTYLLGSPLHLAVFAAKVTAGEVNANAKLIADIDLEGTEWQSIGEHSNKNPYKGTFDGQGHKITNFTVSEFSGSYHGLFSYVSGTVKNFSISGEINTYEADYVGVVGEVDGGKIQNVHSALNITTNGVTKHTGGVVGGAINSAQVIGCSYSGTLNIGSNGDSFGGIIGYAGAIMKECLFNGVVMGDEGNEASYVGGLQGYANSTAAVLENNLCAGKVLLANAGAISGTFRSRTPDIYVNNFWLSESATRGFNSDTSLPKVTENTIEVSAETLASGEVAFKLNPEGETYFYQTLGTDTYPVLDNTHAIVYSAGEFTCDGHAKGEVSYSNNPNDYRVDPHQFNDGVCDVCHMTPDGYFGIKTGEDLRLFADKVNTGEMSLNGKLVADIDLSNVITEENPWIPAGDWGQKSGIGSLAYKGHFDGQGHTITGFNATSSMNYFGIFGVCSTDVLIENFTIYGTIVLKHKTGGVVGYTRDTETTIRNIHSYLNIQNGANGNRPGGILGSAVNGTTNIENCTYSGTLTTFSDVSDTGGNYGGILGYVNNNTLAIVNMNNCLFDGEVINTSDNPGGCTFGGFIGYSNSGIVTIKNSLSIGKVQSSVAGQYFGAVKQAQSAIINSYYTGESVNGSASTVEIPAILATAEQLASGEICYLLNVDNQDANSIWFQTLGEDAYPVLDKTHKVVLYDAYNGYHNPSKDEEDGIDEIQDSKFKIQNGDAIFNLAGQRISRLQKGLNIVSGKKVVILK